MRLILLTRAMEPSAEVLPALGLLAHNDTEDVYTRSRSELLALIQIAFGGMVAEALRHAVEPDQRPGLGVIPRGEAGPDRAELPAPRRGRRRAQVRALTDRS